MNRKVHQRQKTKLFQKYLLVGYFNFSHDKKQFILILSNHQLESEHSFLLQINLFHRIGSQRKELRVNVRAQRCYKIQKGCGTKSTNELYQSSCCCCSEVFRQTFIPFPLQMIKVIIFNQICSYFVTRAIFCLEMPVVCKFIQFQTTDFYKIYFHQNIYPILSNYVKIQKYRT